MDPDQTAHTRAVRSRFTLFVFEASNISVAYLSYRPNSGQKSSIVLMLSWIGKCRTYPFSTLIIKLLCFQSMQLDCQAVWFRIRTDFLSGPTGDQTVCIWPASSGTMPISHRSDKFIYCIRKCLFNMSIEAKRCGPRSDCSYRSSPIWINTVCLWGFKYVSGIFTAPTASKKVL